MSLEIPITVNDTKGIARLQQPLTMGLPFPRALLRDVSRLDLANADGTPRPVQVEALSRWPDGSIKWCLLDFQVDVPPRESVQYLIRKLDEPAPFTRAGIGLVEVGDGFHIHTGSATFTLERALLLPSSWAIDGACLAETFPEQCVLEDANGHTYTPRIRSLSIETLGPLRTTLRSSGTFAAGTQDYCNFVARLSFFANSAVIRLALTIHNPRRALHRRNLWDLGDPGSIYIRDLHLELQVAGDTTRTAAYSLTPDSAIVYAGDTDFQIYQDSSGGPNWASHNHLNRHNELTTSFRGYRVSTPAGELTGDRAQPLVILHSGTAGVAAAVRDFWQNFPQAIEVSDNSLIIRLLPRQSRDVHELQGGEQKTYVTHLSLLRSISAVPDIAWIRGRLIPHAPPEWYASSHAIPYLTPRSAVDDKAYLELVDGAIEGVTAFASKREIIDEYGWRNFGDVYADHETVYADGQEPVVSHYNNQYDVVYGALFQFLRSGEARWFSMMEELAWHVVDIDIYHTEADRSEYSGGMFWHTNHYTSAFTSTHRSLSRRAGRPGGGPSTGHCYTAGLMHHYFLTGETASREAVIGLARWIIAMEDGSRSRFRWLDRGPTGRASATYDASYHGPGRGPANATNTLLDAFVLTGERKYVDAAEAMIRRCIHPCDDIQARRLLDAERRWSYTMFLQMLGRYLDLKIEHEELDVMYGYARQSLLAYAAWMAQHEVSYLTTPERLEFPTETWSAQDMRKCDVFNFAAKHCSGQDRERFREHAASFFRSSVQELVCVPTRSFTRPTTIMMTCGYTDAYFRSHPEERAPTPVSALDFGVPGRFVPQRTRVLKKMMNAAGIGFAAALALAYYYFRRRAAHDRMS